MANQSYYCISYVFQLLVIYCAAYLIFTSYFTLIKLRCVMHGIGTMGLKSKYSFQLHWFALSSP